MEDPSSIIDNKRSVNPYWQKINPLLENWLYKYLYCNNPDENGEVEGLFLHSGSHIVYTQFGSPQSMSNKQTVMIL